ncbi:MAG: shikimate dehydrogenase [Nitrososphaeria archaeon]|nr:shikimate dehydrogenase [Nitrososphaeria archaeon]
MVYDTRVCCLIGDPIEHTVSPIIHNAAFQKLGLNYLYLAFKVKKSMLKEAIEGIKALNIKGLNVTIPHKIEVVKYLNEVDEIAERIGAVNTIVNKDGVLKGYNTDGEGALMAIKENGFNLKNKIVAIVGAGGAARAVSHFIVLENPSKVTILNRTLENAIKLAEDLRKKTKVYCEAKTLDTYSIKESVTEADLLINCTSVGMYPDVEKTPIPKDYLKKDLVIMDIVYNPLQTRLLRDAVEIGCKIINGLDMLVNQAALSFKIWTGIEAPLDIMKKAALEVLEKKRL